MIYLKTNQLTATEKSLQQIFSQINTIKNSENYNKIYNFVLEIQGQLELEQGKTEIALQTWRESSNRAYERGDLDRFIYAKSKQIEILQTLGLYAQTRPILEELATKLAIAPDNLTTAQAWKSLANISVKLGNFKQATNYIEKALQIAKSKDDREVIADILSSQGNIEYLKYRRQFDLGNRLSPSLSDIDQYIKYYRESASLTANESLQITAKLGQLSFLTYVYQKLALDENNRRLSNNILVQIDELINTIEPQINNFPLRKKIISQRLNLSDKLIQLKPKKYQAIILSQLTKVIQESEQLNYQRGKSEALGKLGRIYQLSGQLSEATQLTQQALYLSETIQAPELTYQWQWQLGRIYQQTNQRQKAIAAYTGAVYNLKSLRRELLGINSELEFNFRENIEPVYRELVDIILQGNPNEAEVKLARQTIDDLQIAELDNYFQEACLNVQENKLEDIIDNQTAIIYPILLNNRIEVIVSWQGKTKHYTHIIEQNQIENKIQTLVIDLNNIATQTPLNQSLQELYNYILQPISSELALAQIENLVFIPDGALKNIPFSALYDGQQYLIENYNVSIAPSLNLVELETVAQKENKALLAGLGTENPNNEETAFFDPLVNVETELNSIQKLIPQTVPGDIIYTLGIYTRSAGST